MGFKRSVQKLRKQYAKKNIDPPIEGKFHKCINETLNDTKFKLQKGKVRVNSEKFQNSDFKV